MLVSNVIAVVAVLISLAYLYFSGVQLRLNKRIRKEATDPYVVPDIKPRAGGSGLLVFTLENIGPTVARDVELSVSPPVKGGERDDWDEKIARAIGRKIPHFPPRIVGWSGSSLSAGASSRTPVCPANIRSRSNLWAHEVLSNR